MTQDVQQAIQKIIDYCSDKWDHADRSEAGPGMTADHKTGRKMAYNDVFQFARTLLSNSLK